MLPKVKLTKKRKAWPPLPEPLKPEISDKAPEEMLAGEVNGMKASAAEERAVYAVRKTGSSYEFRRAINAPRYMPGWKELDLLVNSKGLNYAFEIDSEFTHRGKERADVLHDAIVLKALEKEGISVYPQVFHIDGESDLVDQKSADRYFRNFFK